MKTIFFFLAPICVIAFLWGSLYKASYDDKAISAIVGEASNQSYDTMICVAQGIRHRGTLKGVYGVNARHNSSESEDTWSAAQEAWDESPYTSDKINGAKNWGTKDDLIKLGICNDMDICRQSIIKCGDLYFY